MLSTTLPALVRLTSLKLNLIDTPLSSEALESVFDVRGLRSLKLINSNVASLPVGATALTGLSGLYWHAPVAYGTEPLQLEVLWRLSSLSRLTLFSSRIREVPDAISQLSNLRSLCVRSRSLASLPASISSLKELRQLSVVDSSLTVLPEFVTALTKLTSFQGDRIQAKEQSPAVQAFLRGLSRCECTAER
jgi:internalin A